MSAPAPAWAEEEPAAPEAVKTEYVWTATEAGKAVGIERLKGVVSPTKKRYISTEVVPDEGQEGVRVTAFHERDPDGSLRKYFRKEDVRLGKGLRAFRRGVGIRMVGVNQKGMKPVEIPKASEHHVWDPTMLSGLAVWLELSQPATEVSFKVLEMKDRTSVTGRLTPVEAMTVGDPNGQAATLRCWKAWAGGAEIATLCGDGAGVMVGLKAGRRTLLLKDWTWKVPPPKPPEPVDSADAGGSEAEDAGSEEPGVGP